MDDQKDQNPNNSINMSSKSYKKCSVVNCKECKGKTLHIFPVSSIDREKVYITNLLKKWIDFCKNPDITLENYKYKSSFIGETHFSQDCYPFSGPKKRLKKGSVPTLKPPLAVPSQLIDDQVYEEPIDEHVHEEKKPLKCSICDKRYASKDDLRIHLYIHETPVNTTNIFIANVPEARTVMNIKNEPISDGIEFENNPWNVESQNYLPKVS